MKQIYILMSIILFAAGLPAQTITSPSAGDGSQGNPYQISSLENLNWIADEVNTAATTFSNVYFIQTQDIDASATSGGTYNSGHGFTPIGGSPTDLFAGNYDGQGFVIDSLYINNSTGLGGSYDLGLFAYTSTSAVIKNVGMTNVNISGYDFVGALVAYDSATVMNCYSTGKVYSNQGDCGGLIGQNNGTIETSFSSCAVSGGSNYSTGGLVGYTPTGTIINCYSTGEVNASGPGAGGLVGQNSGTAVVDDCYTVSKVTGSSPYGGLIGAYFGGTITRSFYNTDSTSSGTASGTGESTANMQTESTYTDSSWDFSSTWSINSLLNGGYPYLQGAHDFSLAVQATDFVASAGIGSVTLSWKTQSEVNNAGFNVLRRQSGVADWQLIASYTTNDSLRGLGTNSAGRTYDFTDNKVISGGTYTYKIQSVSTNGTTKDLSTLTVIVDVPKTFAVYQNYPNPFNPSTTIRFDLKEQSNVTLDVFNVLGQRVEYWNYGLMNAGRFNENVNMSHYASGVYFYRIVAEGAKGDRFVSIKKMLELK
jgi:Secretion system C-terminal sorting domain/The GLUG motif